MNEILSHIVTHPGGSHKDEFLACCVMIANQSVPIYRRDPSEDELIDPCVAVIDIGHKHESELSNFDHHQFPRDHIPQCSLSLVLQAMGLYDDAKTFCEWLETLEWFDSRGAIATAKWLGTSHEVVRKLNSPMDVALLKQFSSKDIWMPEDPLWLMMKEIGEGMIKYLHTMHDRMIFIEENHEIWTIKHNGNEMNVLFMPRTNPLPDEPSLGLNLYLDRSDVDMIGLVYPDRRGEGYGLSRYNDHPDLDFNRVAEESDVHFAHARGFLAKSSATNPKRLQSLIQQAWLKMN